MAYLTDKKALDRELILGYLKRQTRLRRHFHASRLWRRLVRNGSY